MSPSHFSTPNRLFDRSNFELKTPRDVENMTFAYLPPDYDYPRDVFEVLKGKFNALGYTIKDLESGKVAIAITNRRPGYTGTGNDYVIYAK